jgi:hypothetical protein
MARHICHFIDVLTAMARYINARFSHNLHSAGVELPWLSASRIGLDLLAF